MVLKTYRFAGFWQRAPLSLIAILIITAVGSHSVNAQEKQVTETELGQLQQDYDSLLNDWRESFKRVSELALRFNLSTQQESVEIRKQWVVQVRETEVLLNRLKPAALRLFDALKDPSGDLLSLMMRLSTDYFETGQYVTANRIAARILASKTENPAMIYIRGRSSVYLNDFEAAAKFATDHSAMIESLPPKEQDFFADINKAIKMYDVELAIQKKEAEADDLPRVEIKTTKGTIVVELFENEAPNTVGNFIDLVEKGHFNQKAFHRVVNHFMAQTGGYTSKAIYSPVDYFIYDECGEPNARRHFRGVLSMAKGEDAHTGGGQFFMTFAPTLFLDGQHTVFGRVLSGWDAMDRLNRTMELSEQGEENPIVGVVPDKVISMKVLRKRDHEYKPDKYIDG